MNQEVFPEKNKLLFLLPEVVCGEGGRYTKIPSSTRKIQHWAIQNISSLLPSFAYGREKTYHSLENGFILDYYLVSKIPKKRDFKMRAQRIKFWEFSWCAGMSGAHAKVCKSQHVSSLKGSYLNIREHTQEWRY